MAYNLKSESEVKEYIKNLGIEYRFGCYSEKNPVACHLLGDFLSAIKKDYEKTAKVYKNNCDEHNYGKSCNKYGEYCLTGRGLKKSDFYKAYQYFDKGCSLNDNQSCFNQGLLLISNNEEFGVKQDVSKGAKLLEHSCLEAENGTACYYLSGLYIAGARNASKILKKSMSKKLNDDDFDIPKNMKEAFKYAKKGCDLHNMYCCSNLSRMYSKGDGVEKNAELAEKCKQKAIELQNEVQSNQTLEFGVGIDQNKN